MVEKTIRQRHVPSSNTSKTIQAEEEEVMIKDVQVEQEIGTRGTLLLFTGALAFAAFTLFVLIEMTKHHPILAISGDSKKTVHSTCVWIFVLVVPFTNLLAWMIPTTSNIATVSSLPKGTSTPRTSSSTTEEEKEEEEEEEDHDDVHYLHMAWKKFVANGHFAIYQTIGWVLYVFFLSTLLVCTTNGKKFCEFGYRTNLAVIAFISEVLIISSVLVLDRKRTSNIQTTTTNTKIFLLVNNYGNMLLIVGALLLAIASEYSREHNGEFYSFSTGLGSLMLCVTSVLNTYGLGGFLSSKRGWRFYQPFAGGAKFILFQIISWSCFGFGAFLQSIYLVSIFLVEIELFVGAMIVAGSLFVISEVLMVVSLLVFKGSSSSSSLYGPSSDNSFIESLRSFAHENLQVVLVGILANVQWVPSALYLFIYPALTNSMSFASIIFYGLMTTNVQFLMVVSRSIATHLYTQDCRRSTRQVNPNHPKYLTPQIMVALIPGVTTLYHYVHDMEVCKPIGFLTAVFYVYVFTYRGQPEFTGSRTRMDWIFSDSKVINLLWHYFQGKIIRTCPLDPNEAYVMGFHPHGILTMSTLWLQLTQQWRELFPGVYAHLLTASVLHHIPLARDLLQIYGSREVTRSSFKKCLEENRSVLLVPGGQAEMIESRSSQKQVRIYTKHKGFIRLAIEHGKPLVPVLSFKEGEMMDNINAPLIQRWFIRKLAFPFPHFPYGRGFLPIPRKISMTVVVGAPIQVTRKHHPTQEEVDKVHAIYFNQMQELFHKHKEEAGCGDYELVLL